MDKLLDNVKTLFVNLYKGDLRKPNTLAIDRNFDPYFDQQIQELSGVDAAKAGTAGIITSPEGPPPTAPNIVPHENPPAVTGILKRMPSYDLFKKQGLILS